MVQEHVALADHGEDVGGRRRLDLAELARRLGDELALLEVVAVEAVQRPQPGQVQRTGEPEDLELVDAELADEQLEHVRVDGLLDLEPHGRAEPAAHELALERLQQVLRVVLLDLDVLVAGDAEGVGLLDLHAREQGVQVRGDDVLERHEPGRADLDEPRQQRRHLHAGEQLGAGDRVAHDDGEVEGQAADVGEGVRGVHGERGEDREDLGVEEELDLRLLGRRELVPAEHLDALRLEVGQHHVAEQVGLLALQLVGALPDVLEHLARRVAAGRPDGDAGGDAPLEAGHADHEELVEVAGEDGEELGPLEDGQLVVLGELEHPLVEGQPRQLTVEEPVDRQPLVDGDGGGRRRERGGGGSRSAAPAASAASWSSVDRPTAG